jgi:antitoxin HigA-1
MSNDSVKIGMKPPHPGGFIRTEILEALDLSIVRAAEILGVRLAALSDLVNGQASLSPEMAFRIEKAFGVSIDFIKVCRVSWPNDPFSSDGGAYAQL